MQELFCLRGSTRQAAPPHWLTHAGSRWTLSWCLWDKDTGTRGPALDYTTLNSDDAAHVRGGGGWTLNVAFTPSVGM